MGIRAVATDMLPMTRRSLLQATPAGMMMLAAKVAVAQQTTEQASSSPASAFSFAAYGDSRPMMYLPFKEGEPQLHQMFLDLFGLVLPEKLAEEVVKRDVQLTFDPVTHELIQIVMPFA